ncbi:MAG: hypothetical protein AB7V45_08125 [Candidatus Krumholzibacteriia bacterium]
MLQKLTILAVLAALGLSAAPSRAFFENTVMDGRARGMGESAVAVPGGSYSAFYNPGLLAGRTASTVGASYVRPFRLDFTDFFAVGAALPLGGRYGSVGIGLSQFKVNHLDTDLLKETHAAFSHGISLFEDYHSRIDMGYSLNVYQVEQGETVSGIDPGSDTVLGVDFGMAVTLHKRTVLGFLVKNLNNPMIGVDEEELHRRLVAGVSYAPYDGVVTTFEFDNELGEDVQYHGGIEMTIIEGFTLRGGVITGPNKLTAGFGYELQGFSLDYGFATGGGTLDSTHQFGLNFAWGGEAP